MSLLEAYMLDETLTLLAMAAVVIEAIIAISIVALRREKLWRASLLERERLLSRMAERSATPRNSSLSLSLRKPSGCSGHRWTDGAGEAPALARRGIVGAVRGRHCVPDRQLRPLPSQDINWVREAQEARWWAIMFLLRLGIVPRRRCGALHAPCAPLGPSSRVTQRGSRFRRDLCRSPKAGRAYLVRLGGDRTAAEDLTPGGIRKVADHAHSPDEPNQ